MVNKKNTPKSGLLYLCRPQTLTFERIGSMIKGRRAGREKIDMVTSVNTTPEVEPDEGGVDSKNLEVEVGGNKPSRAHWSSLVPPFPLSSCGSALLEVSVVEAAESKRERISSPAIVVSLLSAGSLVRCPKMVLWIGRLFGSRAVPYRRRYAIRTSCSVEEVEKTNASKSTKSFLTSICSAYEFARVVSFWRFVRKRSSSNEEEEGEEEEDVTAVVRAVRYDWLHDVPLSDHLRFVFRN